MLVIELQRSNEKSLGNMTVESVFLRSQRQSSSFEVITPTSIEAFASAIVSPEFLSRNSTRLSTVVTEP